MGRMWWAPTGAQRSPRRGCRGLLHAMIAIVRALAAAGSLYYLNGNGGWGLGILAHWPRRRMARRRRRNHRWQCKRRHWRHSSLAQPLTTHREAPSMTRGLLRYLACVLIRRSICDKHQVRSMHQCLALVRIELHKVQLRNTE